MSEEEVYREDNPEQPEEEQPEAGAGEEEVEEEEQAVESEEEEEEEQPKKSKKSAQQRIKELTRKYRQTERELQELKRLQQQQQTQEKETRSEPPKKPSREQFEDEDAYLEALADYRAETKLYEREQKQQTEEQKRKQQEQYQEFQTKIQQVNDTGEETFDDYDEVVIENPDLPITDSMAQTIAEMDSGHYVAYYLGKNPQKASEIAQKSSQRQAVELARIETQQTQKPKKNKTQAPPPVNPVSGKKETGPKDPEKMTTDEWMEWRYEQLNKKR